MEWLVWSVYLTAFLHIVFSASLHLMASLFMAKWHSFWLKDILFSFRLLVFVNNTRLNINEQFFAQTHMISPGHIEWSGIAGQIGTLCLTFWDAIWLLSRVAVACYIHARHAGRFWYLSMSLTIFVTGVLNKYLFYFFLCMSTLPACQCMQGSQTL